MCLTKEGFDNNLIWEISSQRKENEMKKAVVIATGNTLMLVKRWLEEDGYKVWSNEKPSDLTGIIDQIVNQGDGFDLAVAEVGVDNWLEFARYVADKAEKVIIISNFGVEGIEKTVASIGNAVLLVKPITEASVFYQAIQET